MDVVRIPLYQYDGQVNNSGALTKKGGRGGIGGDGGGGLLSALRQYELDGIVVDAKLHSFALGLLLL